MTNLNIIVKTDSSMIRALCIRQNWYTDGTCRAYDNLLNYCEDHKVLDEDALDFIAWDIFNHSTNFDYSYSSDENVENIKYYILNDATYISRV